MDAFEFTVEGIKELKQKLSPEVFDKSIKLGMSEGAWHMVRWAQDNRMSGPRPKILSYKTNLLKNSITASPIEKIGEAYQTKIGTNKVYARIHEYGFRGIEQVRTHIRNMKKQVIRMPSKTKRLGKKIGTTVQVVSAHTRNMNMPARPYLRPAIQEPSNIEYLVNNIKRTLEEAMAK